MKLSGRTIFIGLATLIIVGCSISYYFVTNTKPNALGWTSSSWLYKKSISIPNKSHMLINKTVSIELDTESLIRTGKLQNDCDDLRFLDDDNQTSLQYWIEGECNTTKTKVLIKIPSLPHNGKTIYVLYGNPTAFNLQEKLTINE
ncbi:MAG TPA: DUF2341 domain-containing protein [Candidatus Dojkabacteria bacterium]|nr:DUF2341 domain-containing protein [Candidatus Dojkabacteria bacterium]